MSVPAETATELTARIRPIITVPRWRVLVAWVPWLRVAEGQHVKGHVIGHRGADEGYSVLLKRVRREKKKAAQQGAETEVFPAVTDAPVPEEELVEQTLHVDLDIEPELSPLPRRVRGAGFDASGQFTVCRGCGQLGCGGSCPPITAARHRSRVLRAIQAGVETGRLDLTHLSEPPTNREGLDQ